jgi:signal transduction histidine kinase
MASSAPGFFKGLSGKVLALTILFVMLGEVLIFLPSIANFRIQFLKSRLAQAEIAALAAEAAPGQILNDELRTEILKGAGVTAVSLQKGQSRRLMLRNNENPSVEESFDLRPGMHYLTMGEALSTLFRSSDRIISVTDFPPNMSGDLIEVAMHEAPLREAMLSFALRILGLSIVLSFIVAAMVFAALNRFLVIPIRKLSANMVAFGAEPENPLRVISPSVRDDEIGMAERELKSMQAQLQGNLQQKAHLASLGLAAAKVSHDLRNMLTSAQLISDSLAGVRDPTVQRFAPKLFTSLDRAINFLNETIKYGKAQELTPRPERVNLSETVNEIAEQMQMMLRGRANITNLVAADVFVDADREHLNRILTNLVRNSVEALASRRDDAVQDSVISVSAAMTPDATWFEVTDNGPGIPAAMREKLFEAFQSADRQGGTGLGLAICAELVRAHGGEIEFVESRAAGTTFRVMLPHVQVAATARSARQFSPYLG